MFAETIIRAKTRSQTPSGSIRVVSELQWTALSQIYQTSHTLSELKAALKSNPWDVTVFSNPANLSPKQISKELESVGASSLFKIIVKRIQIQMG